MAEIFTYGDSQQRAQYGVAPDSSESAMMRSLLGDQAQQQGLELYDGVARTHDHVADLQVGASLGYHLMTNMIQAHVSIATLLPAQEVNPSVTYFSWTVEYANPGVAPTVPEEAPFYEITYETEQRQAKLERRGVALRMTANIMQTVEGMARLRSQLIKLAATMLITIEYLTMRAIVTAHDGPMYRRKMTLDRYSPDELSQRLDYDAAHFGSWNRSPDTEATKDTSDVSRLLNEYSNGPFTYLYPAGQAMLMNARVLERPQGMEIQVLDPNKAILQMESPKSSLQMADGSLAFPVPDYAIGDHASREQPLLRTRLISEHMLMSGVPCDDLGYRVGKHIPGGGFATCMRDRHPYDTGIDQWGRVAWADAFRHALFVPERQGDPDPIDDYVALNELRPEAFRAPRSAPSRTYYNNGVQPVRIFGQFDQNVVSRNAHRMVGSTIAGAIHNIEGSEVAAELAAGLQLVRALANARYQDVFRDFFQDHLAAPQPFAAQAPDMAVIYRIGNDILATPQHPDGSPQFQGTWVQDLDTAVNANGTPPFLFCVGGIRMLANLAENSTVTGRTRELANSARNLMDVSERIYNVLVDKFPDAAAFDPAFRPINHLPADGFATFFTSVILNSGNAPVLIQDVVTPFVWTSKTISANVSPNWGAGTAANPLVADANPQLQAQGRIGPSHTRTSWAAHHIPMAAAMKQRQRGGLTHAGRVMPGTHDDEDLFGNAPSFRSGDRASMMAGAPVSTEPTALGIHSRTGALAINPMDNQNATENWDAADKIDDMLVRICTMTYLTAYADNLEAYNRMMESNILVPFDIYLVRPAMEFDMYTMIGLKAGITTGANVISQTQLDFGKNVDVQTRRLTYSMMHQSVVTAPDNIAMLPDRIARQYNGGANNRFYTDPSEFSQIITERPDIIAMIVPMDHKFQRREPTGGIDLDGLYGPKGSSRFPDARYYENIWHLSEQATRTENMRHGHEDASQAIPNYSWLGESLNWNKERRCRAAGHRRGGSHPGCLDVWNGNKSIFPDPPPIPEE